MFHMKQFTSKTQKIGELGEKICIKWLNNNGFKILERNYTKKSGEIDIICSKDGNLYFIEVKSANIRKDIVSRENQETVTRETLRKIYNPAENVTKSKIRKCYTTIQEYLRENKVSHETKYQFDVFLVFINQNNRKHFIDRIENVVYM